MPHTHPHHPSSTALAILTIAGLCIAGWNSFHAMEALWAQGMMVAQCYDTDNGNNPYVAGGIGYNGSAYYFDSCRGSHQLDEWYCNGYTGFKQVTVNCQYGCYNGACLKSPPSCKDTDNGQNTSVAGTTTIYSYEIFSSQDYCDFFSHGTQGGSHVVEFYCGGSSSDPSVLQTILPCEVGCMDGRCITEQEKPFYCNNGTHEAFEECDDSNGQEGDGCSNSCKLEAGWQCYQSYCQPINHDGLIRGEEQCDDGDSDPTDGCGYGIIYLDFECRGEPSVCYRNGQDGKPYACKVYNTQGEYVGGNAATTAAGCWSAAASASYYDAAYTVRYNGVAINADTVAASSSPKASSVSSPSSKASSASSKLSSSASSRSSSSSLFCGDSIVSAQLGEQCEPPNTFWCSAQCKLQISSSAASVGASPLSSASPAAQGVSSMTSGAVPNSAAAQSSIQATLQISSVGGVRPAAPARYSDVQPYTELGQVLTSLSQKGIIGGYPDGTFRPDDLVNRAEAAKILMLALGNDVGNLPNDGRFSDVQEGAWYVPYVMKAEQLGIINGHPDGTFRPTLNINRAEYMKMLSLTFGTGTNYPYYYQDVPPDAWYAEFVGLAYVYNLFDGGLSFRGEQPVTRGEIALSIEIMLQTFPR